MSVLNITEIEGITGQFKPYGGYGTFDYKEMDRPPMGKYKVTTTDEETTVWKSNPNATGDYNSKIAVRTLKKGTVVNVISEGTTMTSWSTTPILNIGNGEWINKSSTNVNSTEQKNYQSQQTQGSTTKEPIYYILVTAGVLIAGYFAYKKFKK
jgi:hypothetical protein